LGAVTMVQAASASAAPGPLRPEGTMGAGLQRGRDGQPHAGPDAGPDAWQAELDPQAATTCADGETLPGIDVSKWQAAIDWGAVAGDGIVYAIIRATHGTGIIDEYFDANWAQARDNGIYAGVYQYFEPDQDPVAQAQLMLDMMGPLGPTDLPPVIDVESDAGLPPAEIASAVGQWIDTVEAQTGIKPIIYTGRYFWQDYVQSPAFADYPLWIAHYTDGCPNIPDQWSDWYFHQYTSSGAVAGIGGDVDRNDFNGDLAALSALFAAPAECGDGLCSGDEDADTCLQDCPPCGTIPAGGGTIDDGDACYLLGGPPEYWRHETQGEGGDLAWTMATDYDSASNYGLVTLHFDDGGRYRVEAHLVPAFASSTMARYQIAHEGGSEDVVVDQAAAAGGNDGWALLGEFSFAAGHHGQSIRLDDNTGEPSSAEIELAYDAIRFTRLDPPSDDTGAGSSDGGGSDDAAGGSDDAAGTEDTGLVEASSDDGNTNALPPGLGEGGDDGGCGCRSTSKVPASLLFALLPVLWRGRRRLHVRR
ncbi:MAG: hypothetical protein K1X88_31830, partial [Nannocystaceae bacterium]|nr:hypothetical protein [Nannocystaceae bacterium]